MKFKKITALFLAMTVAFSLISCGQTDQNSSTGNSAPNESDISISNASVSSDSHDENISLKPRVITADRAYVIEEGDKGAEEVIFDEKIMTIDELFSFIEKVELTPENFFDYFYFAEKTVTYDIDTKKSVFQDEKITKEVPESFFALLRNSDNDNSFFLNCRQEIATRFSYQITEETSNNYSLDGELLSTRHETSPEPIQFDRAFYYNSIPNSIDSDYNAIKLLTEKWTYDYNEEILVQTLCSIANPVVEKVEGTLYFWNEIPDSYWNVTPKGFRFLSVKADTGDIVRMVEYLGDPRFSYHSEYIDIYYLSSATGESFDTCIEKIIDIKRSNGEEYAKLSDQEVLIRVSGGQHVIINLGDDYGFSSDRVK